MASTFFAHLAQRFELDYEEEEEVRRVYRLVPSSGSTTARQIAERLNVPEKTVQEPIDQLKAVRLVDTGKGRSRSVERLPRNDHEKRELDLYAPMKRELEERWAAQPGREYYPPPGRYLRVLVNQGENKGTWTRPDLTLVGGKTLPYLPGKFLDVVTFEVKFWPDLKGLYEALAHRRRATHSYVVYFPRGKDHNWEPHAEDVARITTEALRYGIGVLLARQEDDFASWKELVEPNKNETDPQMLHSFLTSLTAKDHEFRLSLRNWLEADPFGDSLSENQVEALALDEESRRVANDYYREIPPPHRGQGPRQIRPTPETVGSRLGIASEQSHTIASALREAGLIGTVRRGGMERVAALGR